MDEMGNEGLIDMFVYHLTVEAGQDGATASDVNTCFISCDLNAPASIAAYLSRNSKGAKSKFVKAVKGYRLQRYYRELLSEQLGAERAVVDASAELRALEREFPEGLKKEFLKEALDCFETGANRAAVVMVWLLTLDHLFECVLQHHLSAFNFALAKNTDKRVSVSVISRRDDFGDMPESRFIELCRSANVISNDVRKILDEKLGTRNSCAHPSGVVIKRSKAIDFFEDLVTNVIQKYPI